VQLRQWQIFAADLDKNSVVDTTDYLRLKAHVMGMEGMTIE
jgi:hypothetical protein